MQPLSTRLNNLRDEFGPLNWRLDNIYDVNEAAKQFGELTLLHRPTGTQVKGRIRFSYSNGSWQFGRRFNHITIAEFYGHHGYPLSRPHDRLVFIEGVEKTPYPVEWMAIVE